MRNGSPSPFYAQRRLPFHGLHPLGFLSYNDIPPIKIALSSHASYTSLGNVVDLVKLELVFLYFPLFTLGDEK